MPERERQRGLIQLGPHPFASASVFLLQAGQVLTSRSPPIPIANSSSSLRSSVSSASLSWGQNSSALDEERPFDGGLALPSNASRPGVTGRGGGVPFPRRLPDRLRLKYPASRPRQVRRRGRGRNRSRRYTGCTGFPTGPAPSGSGSPSAATSTRAGRPPDHRSQGSRNSCRSVPRLRTWLAGRQRGTSASFSTARRREVAVA